MWCVLMLVGVRLVSLPVAEVLRLTKAARKYGVVPTDDDDEAEGQGQVSEEPPSFLPEAFIHPFFLPSLLPSFQKLSFILSSFRSFYPSSIHTSFLPSKSFHPSIHPSMTSTGQDTVMMRPCLDMHP